MEYMDQLWDDIGISGWNKDFAKQFGDEQLVDIAFDQVTEHNDYKLAKNEKIFDDDEGGERYTKEDLFDASIEADGLANTLAGYDGHEVELSDGSLMYRHN